MKTLQRKYVGVRHVIEQDAEHYRKDWYIKVMTVSLIMSGPTGQAAWIGYQLVSCLVMLIG